MNNKNLIKYGSIVVGSIVFISLIAQNPILAIMLGVSAGAYFYAEKFIQ